MARAPRRTLTRTAAIKKLLDYRSESWDSDDTRKVIRKGRKGLHEMSNRELAGLWEDWFEQRITVTGHEPLATITIETSIYDAVVTALTDLTACVSMRGPSGTTAYLISEERMNNTKGPSPWRRIENRRTPHEHGCHEMSLLPMAHHPAPNEKERELDSIGL